MAKMYRVVPDTISTLLTTGYLSSVTEDLLYKSGFFSYGDNDFGYFGTYEKGKGKSGESTKDYVFFFNSPWSCFKALNFFSMTYGHEVARILEYDIPYDIIDASNDAFTNYSNFQAKGKKIPVEVLRRGKTVFNQFSDDLRTQLEEIAIHDVKESMESFSQSIQDSKSSIYKNNSQLKLDSITPSRIQKINDRKFKKSTNFFETDAITGKSMIITRADRERVQDVLSQEKPIDDLSEILKKSNGMLTLDNFKEYDGDLPEHQYGMITSY